MIFPVEKESLEPLQQIYLIHGTNFIEQFTTGTVGMLKCDVTRKENFLCGWNRFKGIKRASIQNIVVHFFECTCVVECKAITSFVRLFPIYLFFLTLSVTECLFSYNLYHNLSRIQYHPRFTNYHFPSQNTKYDKWFPIAYYCHSNIPVIVTKKLNLLQLLTHSKQ